MQRYQDGAGGRWRQRLNSIALAFSLALIGQAASEPRQLTGFDEALRQIADSEYHIRLDEATGNYKSANRAQNLRFTYGSDGFHVEVRKLEETELSPWDAAFQLAGVHRGEGGFTPPLLRTPAVESRQALFDYPGMRVEYLNDTNGMRQNFHLESRPPGRGPLRLEVLTKLRGVHHAVAKNGDEVILLDDLTEQPRMHYADLVVWDANGRTLRAEFEATRQGFAIVVDDESASYPLVVDPLSYTSVYGFNGPSGDGEPKFGFAVAFNKYAVVVGAPYFDSGTKTDAGKVFLFSISPSCATVTSTAPAWSVEGENAYDRLGWAVAGRGNAVGQGLPSRADDIIASAPGYDQGSWSNAGKVYVWTTDSSTKLPASTTADWTATGGQSSEGFGTALSVIYSVKADGKYSLAVGSPNRSRVVVYYGTSSGLSSSPNWNHNGYIASQTGTTTWSFGSSIAMRTDMMSGKADDVNGDTYGDLIVGAPNSYDLYGYFCGYVYVFHGSAAGLSSTTSQHKKIQSAWGFGHSVAYAEDSNGDGIGDVAVGYPADGAGKVYVYSGGSGIFSGSPLNILTGEFSGDQFGYSISAAGNPYTGITLAVGAPYNDVSALGLINCGAVYLFTSTGSGYPSTANLEINDLNQGGNSNLGWSISTFYVGRVECPNAVYPTWVLMGAPGNVEAGSNTGAATIWKITN